MNVLLKTVEQLGEMLGQPFKMPDGCAYQAVFDGRDVIVGVDESLVARLWLASGLGSLCDVLSKLISEAQGTPGIPVVYGPRGVERRSHARLELVRAS